MHTGVRARGRVMALTRIRVSNFKSFDELNVQLGKFNALIGANASGKSNFIAVFKFLRDIVNDGLDNAMSMQGGIEYLRNATIGRSRDFLLEIVSDTSLIFRVGQRAAGARAVEDLAIEVGEAVYQFAISFGRTRVAFRISNESLTQKCRVVRLGRRREGMPEREVLGEGQITVTAVNGKTDYDTTLPNDIPIRMEDFVRPVPTRDRPPGKTLLLEKGQRATLPFFALAQVLSDIAIYDFDPRLPKKAVPITGKTELEESGENLAIVLNSILTKQDSKREFSDLMRDLLPFIEDIGVMKFADKSLLFKLRETFADGLYLPASLLSDGTMNVTALIVALYFEDKAITIIEEPERNIHPYLISRVVNMIKEASQKKQIVLSTHNPEIVKWAGLEDILLVSRDEQGFSSISRPAERERVRIFLENEMGVDELYVQNLLGV